MTDYDRVVKVPINEPAEGLRKSQIQVSDFIDTLIYNYTDYIDTTRRNMSTITMDPEFSILR